MTTAQADYAPEWLAWIAQNLIRGVSQHDVVEHMVNSGIARGTAVRAAEEAKNHPYVTGATEAFNEIWAIAAKNKEIAEQGGGAAHDPNATRAGGGNSSSRAQKYAWFLEVARRNAKQASWHGTVPRVHKPSRQEFLDEYYAKNQPVVITGALDDWDALKLWTGDYLKEKLGDRTVEVQANRNTDANYELNSGKLKKEMNFGEFVDIVESGEVTNDWYITANNGGRNQQELASLWDDITFPDYLTGEDPNNRGFFWYGPAGTVTPIHHDLTNNFMAQVRGRKRIKIVAPYESAYVYNNQHCFSPVDLENVDLEQFPQMEGVTITDVEIGPGDLFFLPVGWWHHVRGLDISITMTFTNFVYENDFASAYETWGPIE